MSHILSRLLALLIAPWLLATPPQAQSYSLSGTAGPAARGDLPPGLRAARILPGWRTADGQRVSAIELVLEPGWKTYWRSPGDSGLPPQFDWSGSDNLAGITLHWPAPEAIRSGGALSFGYHDRLILPFSAAATEPGKQVTLHLRAEIGLCENICVPATLELTAGAARATPDPRIQAALAAAPARIADRPTCGTRPIEDGMRLTLRLPAGPVRIAAVELEGHPEFWVSEAELTRTATGTEAVADIIPPSGAPFDVPTDAIITTLIAPDGSAREARGCDDSPAPLDAGALVPPQAPAAGPAPGVGPDPVPAPAMTPPAMPAAASQAADG